MVTTPLCQAAGIGAVAASLGAAGIVLDTYRYTRASVIAALTKNGPGTAIVLCRIGTRSNRRASIRDTRPSVRHQHRQRHVREQAPSHPSEH